MCCGSVRREAPTFRSLLDWSSQSVPRPCVVEWRRSLDWKGKIPSTTSMGVCLGGQFHSILGDGRSDNLPVLVDGSVILVPVYTTNLPWDVISCPSDPWWAALGLA